MIELDYARALAKLAVAGRDALLQGDGPQTSASSSSDPPARSSASPAGSSDSTAVLGPAVANGGVQQAFKATIQGMFLEAKSREQV